MSTEVLQRRFNEIGAHLQVAEGPWHGTPRINVLGSTFDVRFGGGHEPVELEVVDTQPADRHLLLLVRSGTDKSKLLCGHDERHWFVAAIPEAARGVTRVQAAKAALQPDIVRASLGRVRPKDRLRRRNAAFVRQANRSSCRRRTSTPTATQFSATSRSRVRVVHRTCCSSPSGAEVGRLCPPGQPADADARPVRPPEPDEASPLVADDGRP